MKDIKGKINTKDIKMLDKADNLSKVVRNGSIRTKDQIQNLSDDGQVTANEYAEDKIKYTVQSVAEDSGRIAKNTTKGSYRKGKKVFNQIKQRRRTADNIKQTAKSTGKHTIKTAKRGIKTAGRSAGKGVKTAEKPTKTAIKTAEKTAKKAAQTAKATKKAAQASARAARESAKVAAKTAKAAAKATVAAIKAIIAGIKSLVAAIIAGGWVAVVIILVICIIGLIVGSCFGIFFSNESRTEGKPLSQVVETLNTEFETKITDIQNSTTYDDFEIESNDGVTSINWEDVLAVFSVKTTTGDNAQNVACLTDDKVSMLRDVMLDMNAISHKTNNITKTVNVTSTDENGNETAESKSITRTVLTVTITHKSYLDMISVYSFDNNQQEQLKLLKDDKYASLWGELLGGYSHGSNEILNGSNNRTPNNIFSWPLQEAGTITSAFGYRTDPINGSVSYHSGVDIGMPSGTPILAAAYGTVTITNSTDSWGGGYGYYVKIKHNDTFDTLYAHCSKICVINGQQVKKGQVIGYVGTTGRSTGPHLHFEVWKNDSRTNALDYFN